MTRELVPTERILQSNRWIGGQKVLLDSDLAAWYGVPTKVLNQAVRRFPDDFLFQLSATEAREHLKCRPYVFTELAQKLAELEQRVSKHDEEIAAIIAAIRQLITAAEKPRREIGFHLRDKSACYRIGDGR